MDDSSAQPEPEQLPPDTWTDLTPPEATASPPPPPPELEQVLPKAVRYIKAKRGGDLAAIFLVGSATRDALLPHSDVNLVVLVHGAENRHELVRILHRIVEIRYLGLPTAEEQLKSSLRLPATLRKAQILFEYEAEGAYFLDQAHARFRQGAPSLTLHEKIRLRHDALHWLGKAEDQVQQPALACYLFSIYLDECINAFHHLRGFWLTAPSESLRFVSQRDPALGDLLQQALGASELSVRFELGHRLADHLFRDIPTPARID
jgi:predicted nucleotidyltransferase